MITGWEYLEKIVQIFFCLPELTSERAICNVDSIVKRKVKLESIKSVIQVITNNIKVLMITFGKGVTNCFASVKFQNSNSFKKRSADEC